MKKIVIVLSFLAFLVINVAFGQTLRFGWPYEKGDVEGILSSISKEIGRPIEIVFLPDYKSTKRMFLNDSIDFCYLNAFSYILAANDVEIKPELLVCLADEKSQPISYTSMILTSKASGITTSDQLVKKAAELNLAFVNASSTSGHLLPRIYLSTLGLDQIEGQFKSMFFAGSHQDAISALANGKADIAACSPNEFLKAKEKSAIKDDQVNVLWTSNPIIQGPIVVNKKMNADVKAKLISAFCNIHPAVYEKYKAKSSMARNSSKYIVAKNEYFDTLRKMTSSLEELIQILMAFYID